ncbi:MAG: VOC family protein [Acidimicrobiia bacterium]
MVKALAFDHLVLHSTDVERTIAWYQRHVGLDGVRLDEWRAGAVPFPSLRVDDNTIVDILARPPGGTGHLDHICFVVSEDDLAAVKAAGELVIEDEGRRFGARGIANSIYVRDPDGLTVELRAYPAR